MNKLVSAAFLLLILSFLQTKAFAFSLDCKVKEGTVPGVKTIMITEDNVFINDELEIPLHKSLVRCGKFGRQVRFDGNALGYQIILKSCSSDAQLEGYLIDSIKQVGADIECN
jgi:hypothetical protein